MTLRTRLLLAVLVTVAAVSAVVSYAVSAIATREFEVLDRQRTAALVAQFQREFDQRSREVTRRVEAIAGSDTIQRMASDLARPDADTSLYLDTAATLAKDQGLDFLDIIGPDGAIISSAHYSARFGYHKDWVMESHDWKALGAFVDNEELPEETAVALLTVRAVPGLFVVGGTRLDKGFLDTLALPPGMRAAVAVGTPHPSPSAAETVHTIPLRGRSEQTPAVLLAYNSQQELLELKSFVRQVGIAGACSGILLGLLMGWWATSRLTRPVRDLASGAREVAGGNWDTHVDVSAGGEIGELAEAFNQMTQQLVDQRGRLVQAERVAAWRELARRLAHELKNPLFPLQITVENLQRARLQHPDQFDEVFRESTGTLLAELESLKTIIGRFSDFAKMPAPRKERLRLDEFLATQIKLFEPQWQGKVTTRVEVEPDLHVEADPEQLSRALRNLVLNAMDAMPGGGCIRIKARRERGTVVIEVSDTGQGLTPEECERLFTPYYTTKQHGTGLGLAIVQSVVSDHGGRITVTSRQGEGSTFRIELPQGDAFGAPADR